MFVEERSLSNVLDKYGKHQVSSDGITWYPLQACKFLNLYYPTHSSFEKSIIERTIQQYIQDRIESFDDYFLCRKKNKCKLKHVKQWLNIFIYLHHKELIY